MGGIEVGPEDGSHDGEEVERGDEDGYDDQRRSE